MLFTHPILERIAAGEVTLAFRRWTAPRVAAGGRQRTVVGVIEFGSVRRVDERGIDDAAARRAGAADARALRSALGGRDGDVYRIELRVVGDDPRVALRARVPDGDAEMAAAVAELDAVDARARGPWAWRTLRLLAGHPGVRAADLAAADGVDTPAFKRRVRRLKEMGLTESLGTGYRLSPRGEAVLRAGPGPQASRPASRASSAPR